MFVNSNSSISEVIIASRNNTVLEAIIVSTCFLLTLVS